MLVPFAGEVFANTLTQLLLSDKSPRINNPLKINAKKVEYYA